MNINTTRHSYSPANIKDAAAKVDRGWKAKNPSRYAHEEGELKISQEMISKHPRSMNGFVVIEDSGKIDYGKPKGRTKRELFEFKLAKKRWRKALSLEKEKS